MRIHPILVCLMFLAACEGTANVSNYDEFASTDKGATNNGGTDTTGETPTPLSGAELYQLNCAVCHGDSAEGTAIFDASIQAYEPIDDIVTQGRGNMGAMPIPSADVAKIQEFLLTLGAPTDTLDGAGLYARYCASCHGVDASGAEKWPNSIQGYEPIHDIVTNGRADMDPVELTDGQTAMVQEYLLTLAPDLSTLTGREVYERLCVGCHGEQGAGTETKGMPLRYDDDGFSEYWIRAGRATSAYDSAMPDYPPDKISDEQVDEMMTWINSAPHASTGEGLFNQYCGNCHGRDGRGGPSGENILGGDSFTGVVRDGKNQGDGYGRRTSYMSAWSSSQISDQEIGLISSYADGL